MNGCAKRMLSGIMLTAVATGDGADDGFTDLATRKKSVNGRKLFDACSAARDEVQSARKDLRRARIARDEAMQFLRRNRWSRSAWRARSEARDNFREARKELTKARKARRKACGKDEDQKCGTRSIVEVESIAIGEIPKQFDVGTVNPDGSVTPPTVCYCKQQFDQRPEADFLWLKLVENAGSEYDDDTVLQWCRIGTLAKPGETEFRTVTSSPNYVFLKD